MNIANQLEIHNQPGFSTIRFYGFVDAATTEEARAIITAKISPDCSNIIIDLSRVVFWDSHGVGLFVSLLKKVHKNGGCLLLAAAAGQPASVLNMVGFNSALVTYCENLQQAEERIQEKG